MAATRAGRTLLTFGKLIGVLVVTGVLAAGVLLPYVGGIGVAASKAADKFLDTKCDLQETALAQSTTIYASDGQTVIATLFKDNRQIISLTAVPTLVQRALIDTEDRRFYEHHGIDTRGLGRALLNASDGGATQGASTLTQQYVKQVRFYQADSDEARAAAIQQSGDRKIYEAKCALDLEKKYTKAQILEKYFNIAYFGEQSYGIAVAARNYFNKAPADLTVPEAASLVGLVKDPTLYDPFQHPKEARERRDEVIGNMVKAGDITAAQGTEFQNSPLKTASAKAPDAAQGCSFANDAAIQNVGFFCDYVIDWLKTKGGVNENKLYTGGWKVVTSIDAATQNAAQANLFGTFPPESPSTLIQPAVDPTTGQILAMATSKRYDYADAHKDDPSYTTIPLFKSAFAGSGSTYKYFALVSALTAGVKPAQALTTAGNSSQRYFPKNCPNANTKIRATGIANAGNYAATLSLSAATVQSSNTYFVGLEDQIFNCNLSTIVGTAQSLGMDALNTRIESQNKTVAQAVIDDPRYTFTLGQEATSALELTEAYGVAANDGVYCQAKPVLSITDPAGKAVDFKQPTCTRQMSQWVARTVVNILTGDTLNGTAASPFGRFFYGSLASRSDHIVAAKTGTNNASRETFAGSGEYEDDGQNSALWFVGLTPHLVAASAVVNVDNPTSDVRIPGVAATSSTSEFFGAYAAQYWIGSFGKKLAATPWFWPAANAIAGASPVPSVVGSTPVAAATTLTNAGFKPVQYPIACGGKGIPGVINYSGPEYAPKGSEVYYCVSNGKPLISAPAAAPAPVPGVPPATTPVTPR
ncbi:MAG: ponA [Pseudonocardiales bacterium]|nr:ponA [Pseudonocardiales bacterium]